MDPIKVLWISAEASPYVKVGGLGDVSGALPVALRKAGVDIRRCLPCYEGHGEFAYVSDVVVETPWHKENVIVRSGDLDEVPTYLFDNAHAFGRTSVYGYTDDAERFSLFCLAIMEWLKTSDFQPDILHLNDWHTAPLAILLRENGRLLPSMHRMQVLLTIHSMAYQGIADRSVLRYLSLPDYLFTAELMEYYGNINLLKGGIVYADRINTVSPTHAKELLKQDCGFGLEGVLFNRRSVFSGILNGIDTDKWDPSNASFVVKPFSATKLAPRNQNKRDLMEHCGFPLLQPLLGFVGRLVESKGLYLILEAMPQLIADGACFVFLGTGDPMLEQSLRKMQEQYPQNVRVTIGFDELLACRIYAGSDIFLMPSLYEPCGLSQMMAMRFGALPLVRKTGGLNDTVDAGDLNTANGFSFSVPTTDAFLKGVRAAIRVWRESPDIWCQMQKRAMKKTFGWQESGQLYAQLYRKIVNRRSRA